MKNVVVLGSGIQGMCSAFALNSEGYDVTIIEKESQVFNKTSLYQEGRIHLGFTYALDTSCETGYSVMSNSYQFSKLFDQWFGKINWEKLLMPIGYYLVHKESFLSIDELVEYYSKLEKYSLDILNNDPSLSYFDIKPKTIYKVLDDIPLTMSNKNISYVVKTVERIVEMFYFKDLLIDQLRKTKIKVLLNTEVTNIERESSEFSIRCLEKNSQERIYKGDIVVNCLWNNRIKLDNTIGLNTLDNPLYRLKIGILGTVEEEVPTCSIVTGVFGNISPRLDKMHAYISWHEECMQGIRTDGTTPKEWEDIISDPSATSLDASWIKNTIAKVSEFVPALERFKPVRLLPGIICSAGKSDIGDKTSEVHNRGSHMGVHSFNNYYSIDTGKFSSAPAFAEELRKQVVNNA
jgi:hypothetical protein